MQSTNNRLRAVLTASVVILAVSVMSACQDLSTRPPAGTVAPGYAKTAEGAEQLSRGVRFHFHLTLLDFMLQSGRFADEFSAVLVNTDAIGTYGTSTVLDSRAMVEGGGTAIEASQRAIGNVQTGGIAQKMYPALHTVRTRASLARKALKAYAPTVVPDSLYSEMMAYEAYSIVMLADIFCSGVPLSILNLDEDYAYRPGSSTVEMYEQAKALFDSALTLASAAPTMRHFASIGKARALLALGRSAEAASAVSTVPEGFVFDLPLVMQWTDPLLSGTQGQAWSTAIGTWITSDKEGGNGMDFLSSNDPRVSLLIVANRPLVLTRLKVATHIEARLIEAEALAQAGDPQYLVVLNRLRMNGTGAGTGGVVGLTALPDTASTLDSRINVVFRERAFWLFFRGYRQGDLRRLIRNYGRTVEEVYPTGDYPAANGSYQSFVDIPVLVSQERDNKNFNGCMARGA